MEMETETEPELDLQKLKIFDGVTDNNRML